MGVAIRSKSDCSLPPTLRLGIGGGALGRERGDAAPCEACVLPITGAVARLGEAAPCEVIIVAERDRALVSFRRCRDVAALAVTFGHAPQAGAENVALIATIREERLGRKITAGFLALGRGAGEACADVYAPVAAERVRTFRYPQHARGQVGDDRVRGDQGVDGVAVAQR